MAITADNLGMSTAKGFHDKVPCVETYKVKNLEELNALIENHQYSTIGITLEEAIMFQINSENIIIPQYAKGILSMAVGGMLIVSDTSTKSLYVAYRTSAGVWSECSVYRQGAGTIEHAATASTADEATHALTADALTEKVVWESTIINNNYFPEQSSFKTVDLSENCSGQYIVAKISIAPPQIISGAELGASTRVQVTRTKQVKCFNNSEHGSVYFTESFWGTNIHFRAQGTQLLFWCDNPNPINGYRIYLETVLVVGK